MVTKDELTRAPVRQFRASEAATIRDLVEGYRRMSFQARNLGRVASVLENALRDPGTVVFLGAAGALIPAGLRHVLREMVEHNLVDVVVTTGAIAYHDLYESRGHRHYMTTPDIDDVVLREHLLDRVYDTVADEAKFREVDEEIVAIADGLPPRAHSSREFLEILGRRFDDDDGFVAACARHGVPYFVPALNDSSIGMALTKHYHERRRRGEAPMTIDPIRDTWELAQLKKAAKRSGVFYIAGGTPKNYISEMAPLLEIMGYGWDPHYYAAQITTDVPNWGGLSGCTFEESQSWGKFHAEAKMAQAIVEASIGVPIVVGHLLQVEAGKGRPRRKAVWDGDTLTRFE
jgi:deoxyhypusine synthase